MSAVLILLVLLVSTVYVVGNAYREVRGRSLNRSLIAAIRQNNTEMVISLLAEGADPNAKDVPSDPRSVWKRLWDQLRGQSSTQDPTAEPAPALLIALQANDDDVFPPDNIALVKALLDAGADANISDTNKNTPLRWAVLDARIGTIRLLLDRGSRINAKGYNGFTVLHDSVGHGDLNDLPMVQFLLSHGASVNARDDSGATPLHCAASAGHTDLARALIKGGADVNVRDKFGKTPIQRAVEDDYGDCVKLLIAYGAQVNTQDITGDTPLKRARKRHNAQIVTILKQAGETK